MKLVEASIADLRAALESGAATAESLAQGYLARIKAYDPLLNAVPVLNPDALADARASDARRAAGQVLGPNTAYGHRAVALQQLGVGRQAL